MFSAKWWHILLLLAVGYAIGIWMPGPGQSLKKKISG